MNARVPLIALVLGLAASCSRPVNDGPDLPPENPTPERRGVHNLHAVGDALWSGSSPEGDDGFRTLRDLGVRTVLSVDGARPDVERARQFGLRYVHVPVGYSGITREQVLQLAKAAEQPGPIYVHCHHGKHRGPTAAALIRLGRGDGWDTGAATAFLVRAGTDPRYEGLYATVRDFRPPTREERAAIPVPPEAARVNDLTGIMVEIDETWDYIKALRTDDWRPAPVSNESPAHAAVRLGEHYREANRLPEATGRPEGFRRMLEAGEHAAGDLEAALRAGDHAGAHAAYGRSARLCAACHGEHRDRGR